MEIAETTPTMPRPLRRGVRSFAEHLRAQNWSPRNHPITPDMVALNCNKKFWFDCPNCLHEFDCSPLNINHGGNWCPYCAIPNQKLCGDIECEFCFNKSFASHEKAKYWSDKNELKPHQVSQSSDIKIWFDCDKCHHVFNSRLGNVSYGYWCPYCAIPNQKLCGDIECEFCFNKSFASHEKAKYWSDKNDKNPHEVALNSSKKFRFDCPNCPHEIYKILAGINIHESWCPYCAVQKLCGDIECEFCFNKSFASHEKAKYWSDKNKLKPHQVARCSGKKIWFDCDKCGHDFISIISNIKKGQWCPICKNKTEKKLLEWLQKQPFIKKVKREYKPKWFKYHCIIKKKHKIRSFTYSYDFLITLQNEKQLIIELDGAQHYVDNIYFKTTALHQQIRDAYKERKAQQHKLKVIRILQEDVWHDRGDWEETLTKQLN